MIIYFYSYNLLYILIISEYNFSSSIKYWIGMIKIKFIELLNFNVL